MVTRISSLFRRSLEWADDESSAARLQRHMRPRVRRRQHSSSHSLGLGPSGRRSKELLSAQRSHSIVPTPRLRCAEVAHPRPDGSSGPPTHLSDAVGPHPPSFCRLPTRIPLATRRRPSYVENFGGRSLECLWARLKSQRRFFRNGLVATLKACFPVAVHEGQKAIA